VGGRCRSTQSRGAVKTRIGESFPACAWSSPQPAQAQGERRPAAPQAPSAASCCAGAAARSLQGSGTPLLRPEPTERPRWAWRAVLEGLLLSHHPGCRFRVPARSGAELWLLRDAPRCPIAASLGPGLVLLCLDKPRTKSSLAGRRRRR